MDAVYLAGLVMGMGAGGMCLTPTRNFRNTYHKVLIQ